MLCTGSGTGLIACLPEARVPEKSSSGLGLSPGREANLRSLHPPAAIGKSPPLWPLSRGAPLAITLPATPRIDYRALLNDEQLAVVEAPNSPALVIAGAGSGKTRTLTFRVARLLETGVVPHSVLLLTFTNRAAREMLKRVRELCGPLADVRRIAGGTFHHVAHALLRQHATVLGFSDGFTLLDREDAAALMASGLDALTAAKSLRQFPRAERLVALLSTSVNTQTPLAEVVARDHAELIPFTGEIVQLAAGFVARKRELQAMDFDDLLLHWKLLLSEHPTVRRALQDRFRAVLVDEYQDTNRLQGDVIDLIAAGSGNLTVVGDDAQAIYGFRGADSRNLIEFPARYPGCGIHKLTQNYRSTPQILALANASIACNRRQFRKELTSSRPGGELPEIAPLEDVGREAGFIASRVLALRSAGVPLSQQAVLYRAHLHSVELQLALTRRGVPFAVRSGVKFFEQAHLKDVLAHLRFVANPRDELAFKRVIQLQQGIGEGGAAQLWKALLRHGPTPLEALRHPALRDQLPKRAQPAFERVAALLLALSQEGLRDQPGALVLKVLEGGYQEILREQREDADARADELRQLAQIASGYSTLDEFLGEVTLLAEFQAEEAPVEDAPGERLTLSSVHQAKGLEWDAVFVISLAEGRFPLTQALREPGELEEERRLFYVAATRARDRLTLTTPLSAAPKEGEPLQLAPSRFLEELPGGLWTNAGK